MKFKYIISILCFVFLTIISQAQHSHCGTDAFIDNSLKNDEQLRIQKDIFDNYLTEIASNYTPNLNKKATIRIIPVVFHVFHTYGKENITKEQIVDQLRILNEDFRRLNSDTNKTRSIFKSIASDLEIEFRLATIDPSGNCTDGITRNYSALTEGGDEELKKLVRWDYRKYLNIWVLNNIKRDPAGGSGKILGYATLPYFTNSSSDGIVVVSDYVGSIGTSDNGNKKGRTLTHEVGHWLGLYHPFQDGCGGSNCNTSGDRICDTPPVSDPSFGCPTSNNTCSNDAPNKLDQVENFMDYADGSCQNMFTAGQKNVINSVLSSVNYRQSNISTSTISATGADKISNCGPIADFYTSNKTFTVCQGNTLTFKDYSYNGEITNLEWTFTGGTPSSSSAKEPLIKYNTPGTYPVSLKASNTKGNNTKTRNGFITVYPTFAQIKAPFFEDFESEDILAKGWQILDQSQIGWKRIGTNAYAGNGALQCAISSTETTAGFNFMINSPAIDLSTIKFNKPVITFNVSYRQAKTGSSEVLFLEISDNCGQSFIPLKAWIATNGLSIDGTIEDGFAPTNSTQYKELSWDLSRYKELTCAVFRFRATCQQGNSIFIDNINIHPTSTTSVSQFEKELGEINISPIPSNGEIHIDFSKFKAQSIEYQIISLSGQIIISDHIKHIDKNVPLNINGLKSGIYFIKFISNHMQQTSKISIIN